jgi:ABC-type multidrug transport system fused ATPase/permease subunit
MIGHDRGLLFPSTKTPFFMLVLGVLYSVIKLLARILDYRDGDSIVIDDYIIICTFGLVISYVEFVFEKKLEASISQNTRENVTKLTWEKLFRFAQGHWTRLLVGVTVLLIRLPFSLAIPHFVSEAIGSLLDKDTDRFYYACMYLVGTGTVDALLDFWCVYIFATAQQEIIFSMRSRLFESILSHPLGFFDKSAIGDIQSRLNSDTAEMGNNLSWVFRFAIEAVVRVSGILGYMFYCSWRLGLLVMVLVPINAFANTFFGQWMGSNAKKCQDVLGTCNSIAQETFSTIQTVKSFSGEMKAMDQYVASLSQYKSLQYKAAIVTSTFYMLVSTFLMNTLGQAGIIVYGGLLAWESLIPTERLVSFLLYRGSLQYYFSVLMETWVNLMKCASISERIFELTAIGDPEVLNTTIVMSLPHNPPEIVFKCVSHRYPNRGEMQVLTNVSFTVASGSCCAIVGPSGSGKSSLLSLLLRLYQPCEGSITVNGQSITQIPLRVLRGRLISIVSQEPVLFRGTIKDNILYSLSKDQLQNLSDWTIQDMVTRALSIACINEFIDSLPQNILTEIGDRGVTLSGGQKQRIAIARAVISNPPILLLDEAMSALDPESEDSVQKALNAAMKSRTTIMVSHRISSVIDAADQVVVMYKGCLVEKGIPQELLNRPLCKNGDMSLRMLYQLQQREYLE